MTSPELLSWFKLSQVKMCVYSMQEARNRAPVCSGLCTLRSLVSLDTETLDGDRISIRVC